MSEEERGEVIEQCCWTQSCCLSWSHWSLGLHKWKSLSGESQCQGTVMWCRVRLIPFAAQEKTLMLLRAWRLTRSIRIQHAFPFLWDLWWAGLWEHKSSHSAPGCTLLSSSVPCRRRRRKKKEKGAKDFQVCHLPRKQTRPAGWPSRSASPYRGRWGTP